MKKLLAVLLLAIVLAAPSFAAKGDMSVIGKLGLGVKANVDLRDDDSGYTLSVKTPFALGGEFFYGVMDNLSFGVGVNYIFDAEAKESSYEKGGVTNLYLSIKPEAKIESKIFSSLYAVGQIGLAFGRIEIGRHSESLDSGLYLGFGIGTVIKDMITVELITSESEGKPKNYSGNDFFRYTNTMLNVGYKFNF